MTVEEDVGKTVEEKDQMSISIRSRSRACLTRLPSKATDYLQARHNEEYQQKWHPNRKGTYHLHFTKSTDT